MRAYVATRSALLTLFLLVLTALPRLVPGASAADSPENSSDVRVVYWVDATFGSAYVSNIMLTNMTPDPIEDWTLEFDLDPIADGIRGAGWEVNGIRHAVTGAGWTHKIEAGQSIWISIDGTVSGGSDPISADDVPIPSGCAFMGVACVIEELEEEGAYQHDTLAVDVAWWVATKGVTQYTAQILMKNVTDEPVDEWTLRFRSNSLITSIEHGDWTRTGTGYEVKGRGWTNSIDPDETIWLTLRGVHTGEVDTLQSCIFNGFPCTFVDPDDLVDAPEEPETPGGLCSIVPADGTDSQSGTSAGIRLDWTPTSFWATGYNYTIDIYNDSDDAIRDWELRFTLPSYMTITQMWNADWSKGGTTVTVRALPYNACIEPDGVVQIGFEGNHDGRADPPSDCEFSGDDCTFLRVSTVAVEDEESSLTTPTSSFELEAPYPNPFSTTTRIPFRVSETQDVDVTLWDMQGRMVGTLYRGAAAAGQAYQINVPAGTLQSGVYMVRLVGSMGSGATTPIMLVR